MVWFQKDCHVNLLGNFCHYLGVNQSFVASSKLSDQEEEAHETTLNILIYSRLMTL